MDKYQEKYLNLALPREKIFNGVYKAERGDKNESYGAIDYTAMTVTVNQDADITVTKYVAEIEAWESFPVFAAVEFNRGRGWEKAEQKTETYSNCDCDCRRIYYPVPLDFEDRVVEIKISACGGIVDDIVLKVVYNEADKAAYYERKAAEAHAALMRSAHIEYEACINFLRVFFTPCNEDYGDAEITLYRDREQFMAKYKPLLGQFCITVLGLGFGDYCFVYRQFDKNGNIILETDKVDFVLNNGHTRKNVY